MRVGRLGIEAEQRLAGCCVGTKTLPTDGILSTQLYCILNKDVDDGNLLHLHLHRLPGSLTAFPAREDWLKAPDSSAQTSSNAQKWMECKLVSLLELKVGAQVMLTRYMSADCLVNGSRGKVVSYTLICIEGSKQLHLCPVVQFDTGVNKTIEPVKKKVRGERAEGWLHN